jgi:DNA-binding Lrp family transcriptional regulator
MRTKLDRIDFEIVAALQNNARLSNKELAAQVGLAPSSCLARVRRLQAEQVLRGFHAEVDPAALGIRLQALIAVRLRHHTRQLVETFRAHLLSLPEVVSVYHVSGRQDFLAHVGVRDADHLRDLALDAFTTRPEVAHIETSLIFERMRRTPAAAGRAAPGPEAAPRRLDGAPAKEAE